MDIIRTRMRLIIGLLSTLTLLSVSAGSAHGQILVWAAFDKAATEAEDSADWKAAKTCHALALREASAGRYSACMLKSLAGLGNSYYHLGEYEPSKEAYDLAVASLADENNRLEDNPEAVKVFGGLARVLHSQKDYAKSESMNRRALKLAESKHDTPADALVAILNALALDLAAQGRRQAAAALARHSGAIASTSFQSNDAPCIDVAHTMARVALHAGEFNAAQQHVTKTLNDSKDRIKSDSRQLGDIHATAALAFAGTDSEVADSHFEAALAIYKKSLPEEHPSLLKVIQDLKDYRAKRK